MAAVPFVSRRWARRHSLRSGRRSDAGGHRHPRADGDGAARRLSAAYRLFRLHRRLHRLRGVWLEPFPVVGRRFHDHADFRRRAGGNRDGRRGGLRRTRGRSRLARRPVFVAGRRVSGGLGRRSSVHSRHDRVSRGHRHPYRDLAGAGATGPASRRGRGVSPGRDDRGRHRRNQFPDAGDRRLLSRQHCSVRENQPAHSRRADRPGDGDFRRRAISISKREASR